MKHIYNMQLKHLFCILQKCYFSYNWILQHAYSHVCHFKGPCDDKIPTCLDYLSRDSNTCNKYLDWSTFNCRKTCGICHGMFLLIVFWNIDWKYFFNVWNRLTVLCYYIRFEHSPALSFDYHHDDTEANHSTSDDM